MGKFDVSRALRVAGVLLGLGLLGLAGPDMAIAWGQELPITAPIDTAGTAPDAAVAGAPAQVASGLPARAPWPRTLVEFWPVFAGFAVSWLGIVAYTLTFGRRIRRVEAAIQQADTGAPR